VDPHNIEYVAANAQPDAVVGQRPNIFLELWQRGYQRLVPIVQPGMPLSPKSTLYRRMQAGHGGIGKVPGIIGADGLARGFDWLNYEADETDLERWHSQGLGVGIITGPQPDKTWLIGIDADTMDKRCAAIISGQVRKMFGLVPTRIGRAPKTLYVVRIDGPLRYSRVEFGENNERVELLSIGRQFVSHGIHPITKEPYRWVEPLVPFADLPVWPAEVL
jgi:Bifunctional DNA primase/polymerase, N-terminal